MDKASSAWSELSPILKRKITENARKEAPLALSPFKWLAGKFSKGAPEKINNAYAKYVTLAAEKADINLGGLAQKGLKKIHKKNTGNFFSNTRLFNHQSSAGTLTGNVEHRLPSLVAPVGKASKVALPMLGAMKVDEMINGDKRMNKQNTIKTADIHKAAEMLTTLNDRNKNLEKQARATKLLYKQAELGQVIFPKTHEEYQEKVAELLVKDLDVVEEAIKMASATEEYNTTYGSLSGNGPTANGSARQNFERVIIEN